MGATCLRIAGAAVLATGAAQPHSDRGALSMSCSELGDLGDFELDSDCIMSDSNFD